MAGEPKVKVFRATDEESAGQLRQRLDLYRRHLCGITFDNRPDPDFGLDDFDELLAKVSSKLREGER